MDYIRVLFTLSASASFFSRRTWPHMYRKMTLNHHAKSQLTNSDGFHIHCHYYMIHIVNPTTTSVSQKWDIYTFHHFQHMFLNLPFTHLFNMVYSTDKPHGFTILDTVTKYLEFVTCPMNIQNYNTQDDRLSFHLLFSSCVGISFGVFFETWLIVMPLFWPLNVAHWQYTMCVWHLSLVYFKIKSDILTFDAWRSV